LDREGVKNGLGGIFPKTDHHLLIPPNPFTDPLRKMNKETGDLWKGVEYLFNEVRSF